MTEEAGDQQGQVGVTDLFVGALSQFKQIWGKALLLCILVFFLAIFLSILIAETGADFGGDGWSAANYLYNWIVLFMSYAVIVRLAGYLVELNFGSGTAGISRVALVRSVFVEIAAVAALMAVPATFDPNDGLTPMDFLTSLPWSLVDTAFVATLIYTAIRKDMAKRGLGLDFNWRELSAPLAYRMVFAFAILAMVVGLTLEYIIGLRFSKPGNMDSAVFDAGTEMLIMGSHFLAIWMLDGLAASVFIEWFSRLPSMRAMTGGIQEIFR